MNKLLEAALGYAANGIAVFPLLPKQKAPLTKNGVLDATTDINKIKNWWHTWPDANIGVPMGKINQILGIDIDYKDGCRPDFLKTLPPTVTTLTPTGGHHAFFKYKNGPIRNNLKIEQGATIRSDGYYFVAPPSIHPEIQTEYQFVNRSLTDGEIAELPELNIKEQDLKKPYELPEKIIDGEGRENHMWRYACKLRRTGLEYEEILAALTQVNQTRVVPPLEQEKIIDRAKRACKYDKATHILDEELIIETVPPNDHQEEEPLEINPIFPVDSLGPLMNAAALEVTEKISLPIEITCSTLLAGAAVCVQPFYNVDIFGSIRPISLNFLTIAESGERKSTADRIILKAHYQWRDAMWKEYQQEKENYLMQLEQWKIDTASKKKSGITTLPKPVRPKAPLLFVNEPTVEGLFFCLKYHRDSVGLFSDEGGAFLGGHSMKKENTKTTIAKLNQLWDGSPLERIRRGSSEEDGDFDILYNKRLSLHIMAQPQIAEEFFNDPYVKSQGLTARFLIAYPESKMGKRKFLLNMGHIESMDPYYDRVKYFLNKKLEEPVVLKLSASAQNELETFYYELEDKLDSGKEYSHMRGFASKAVEHVIRIAAVIGAFTHEDFLVIDDKTIQQAIKIIPFYLVSHKKTLEKSSEFPNKECEILYQTVSKKSAWKLRDLMRKGPKKLRKKEILVATIKQLENLGYLSFDPSAETINT